MGDGNGTTYYKANTNQWNIYEGGKCTCVYKNGENAPTNIAPRNQRLLSVGEANNKGQTVVVEYDDLYAATLGKAINAATNIRKAIATGTKYKGVYWYAAEAEEAEPAKPTFTVNAVSHIRFPPRPRLEPTPEEINECYVMLRQLYLGQLQEIPEMFRYDPVPQNKRGILAPTIHDARRAAYIKLGQQYAESVKDGLYVVADDGRYQFEDIGTAAKVLVVAAAAITPSRLRQKRLGEYAIEVIGENATAAWNELLAELEKYE